MVTSAIHSEHAASAAALVQLIRSRPNDLIDPDPPSAEMEVLVDMGARGKGDDAHPRISIEGARGGLGGGGKLRRAWY